MQDPSQDLKGFINACVRGDATARRAFQETYGALIYTFPVRIYHLSKDEAGDFYLYVFDNERIFRRVRTFEGRNAMQFETYLSYYVLRDLFLEWRRSLEWEDTVSLEAPVAGSAATDERPRTLHDVLPAAQPAPATRLEAVAEMQEVEQTLRQLEPEKRLLLKLLALGAVDLAPDDVRALAQLTGRSIRDTLGCLEEIGTALAAKAMKAEEKWQALHTVAHWIRTYQHQITALEERLQAHQQPGATPTTDRLAHDKAELERKLLWRYEQQARLREELHKLDVRPSYKDMAALFKMPLGTICSRIARAREEFGQKLAAARAARA